MTYALGIDLGTTNSCVAVLEAGDPQIIDNCEGGRTTPSVVALTADGEWLLGQVARRQAVTNPEHTVFSIKRFMGRRFDDPDVQRAISLVPYAVVPGARGDAYVTLDGHAYAPPQVAAQILSKIKADVEARLGESVTQAVITVPAYFDDVQRQATKQAGTIAGLDVIRIINEPTAAALAYGVGREQDEIVAVYDLGGGTFDISILQLGDGIFEVKSTNGDTHLGGDDFDERIIGWLAESFAAEHGIDLRTDRMALQRLKEAAEKAKIELSTLLKTQITLPFIAAAANGPLHLNTTLTRARLEALVADLVEATAEPCRRALADADVRPEEIAAVILVGGQTRMPAVQALVRDIFGREPSRGVNPDEAVAAGAAIQAGALTGAVESVLLLDVTPLTLGVETHGGAVAPLIARNTTIPTTCREVFTTGADGQDTVAIHIVQGERPLARENRTLARFHLEGIVSAPRGVPQIEVSFTLDANGLLGVAARDLMTGRAQDISVTPAGGLTQAEVDRMVLEAAQYREEDQARQDLIALSNAADAQLYQAARAVRETGDRLSPEQLDELEALATALELALPTGDVAQIQDRMGRLQQAIASLHADAVIALRPETPHARRLAG